MIGDPSMLRLIRKAAALARIFPTLDLSIEEKAGKVIQEASSFFSLYRFMINKKKNNSFDGALREVARTKILHYRQLYLNRPDPIVFLPAAADTTGRVYDDFSRLLFLNAHREASALTNEIPEESGQFRFLRAAHYANIKGSVGLILAKTSAMRISIPLDLSSRPFIPLPRFICRRRPLPLLASSLVFTPRRSA